MREIDRLTTERFGTPSLVLMENAATAVVRAVETLCGGAAGKRVLVLCGKGNNGGDGAATAHLLAVAGALVDVILLGTLNDTAGDARTNFERLQSWNKERALREESKATETGALQFVQCDSDKAWAQLLTSVVTAPHEVIIDALFGTGLTRPVAGLHREAIDCVNRLRSAGNSNDAQRPLVISIDIPSGLNSDSNEPIGETIFADATVTMTAAKLANVLSPAANYNGKLLVADIGSPAEIIAEASAKLFLVEEGDARRWLIQTRYRPDSYKNSHGHVAIVAGSRGFTGAAALCANAAMRSGAGLVTVATPASAQPLVATQVMPEVMTTALAETDRGTISDEAIDYFLKFSERADAIAIGPGLSSEDDRTRAFVKAVVEKRNAPVVIDADGLNCLSPWPANLRGSNELPIVLTPHAGEMLRLIGTDDKSALNDRVSAARDFATQHNVILLLKGTRSLVAAPDGQVSVNSTGNPGLGTAGSGDTLTGIIAGFLAQSYGTPHAQADALDAVVAALYVGGLAGDIAAREIGMRAMVASDIREHLSAAFRLLDQEGETPGRF